MGVLGRRDFGFGGFIFFFVLFIFWGFFSFFFMYGCLWWVLVLGFGGDCLVLFLDFEGYFC